MAATYNAILQEGTYKPERVVTSAQAASITIQERPGSVLNFCANNYLGLNMHPEVVAAAREVLDTYGVGVCSTRFICGTQDLHKSLERTIAEFHGAEDAALYPSCYDANAGLFEVMLGEEDAVFSDQINHASIIDGIRLCRARKYRYKHLDMADLSRLLEEGKDARLKVIVSDGVFSMDGAVAPLKEISQLAEEHNALVFLDECHATGFFGKTGRGTEEYYGLTGKVDIINSTLGKALGGASGGYTVGPKELIDMLRQRSRPYLYSNSLPPPVVASASKAFELLMRGSPLLEKLVENTKRFRKAMTSAGFTLRGQDHPVAPVMLGEARLAAEMAEEMLKRGVYVIGMYFPVVPKGEARIRVQISAIHSPENIDKCVEAFIDIGRQKGVIS